MTSLASNALQFLLLAAAVLALPLSLFLIRRYRETVVRLMRAGAGAWPADSTNPAEPNRAKKEATLELVLVKDSEPGSPRQNILSSLALSAPWRTAAIYAMAGSVAAVMMAVAYMADPGLADLRVQPLLMMCWIYAWPVVLAAILTAASTRRTGLSLVAAYFFGFFLLGIVLDPGNFTAHVLGFAGALLWYNFPATGFFLAFLHRKVRAIGPFVYAFTLIVLAGMNLTLLAFTIIPNFVTSNSGLGLNPYALLVLSILLGLLASFSIGWLLLSGIRARYRAKKVNDQSLLLDALWLVLITWQAIFLVKPGREALVLVGVAAFVAFRTIVWAGFSLLRLTAMTSPGNVQLLVLRVFSLGARSARLFTALALHWRYLGSIQLIAGPDLATSTIEPHELLDFAVGKLARRFIDRPEALNQRFAEMDLAPDQDGRYRVNDFFCRADAWQRVLSRLVEDSDVVLMDLRGFSQRHAGCVHEIHELIHKMPLPRVLLVVDERTDMPFLEKTVADAWSRLRPDSPNRTLSPAEIRAFLYSNAGSRAVPSLVRHLCGMAALPSGKRPFWR